MKIPETLKLSRLLRKDRRGVALVTVLTVMALTTILVLTFFSLATSEHRASNTYSNGLQAQQVAEEAVNLVIAQIREATTIGTSTAWASQPGAIRNWDEGGNPESAFKLYSDDQMKTMDWTDFQTDFLEASNWSSRPSHFVDLNEPVIRGEKVYYPIVHPAASTVPKWPKALGDDDSGVEGFSYNQGDMKLSDAGKIGSLGASISKAEGHVAMPVRWIYQLADGTLGVLSDTPSGGSPESFSFNKISGDGVPSEVNPMVARFAFWADDETSKLNINTAAGGLAWDIPKAGGELDMNMGKYQPAQKEWQRYPGHPASTHLGPALAPGVLDIVNDRDAMEMLYRVVPRIVGGGSESGTRLIDTRNKAEANGLVADKEPLFPTLDDVIMRADREPHQFPDPTGQAIPPKDLSDYLERSKFFVTANSRAPETNMFNLPRVAIWPIYNSSGDDAYSERLTTFDRLIRYCASMGKSDSGYPRHEYIFKRENANSTKVDYQNITRNKELYSYLQEFLERPIPGYGGTFQGKYGTNEHKQILTEIFDYIRMTNLHDDSLFVENFADAFQKVNTEEHRTYTNARDDNNKAVGLKGHGQVVPIEIDGTKGFGRFYTVSGVQIQVISVAEPDIEGNRRPLHFGSTSYKNRKVYPISTRAAYLNFPPMPFGFEKDMAHYADHEPLWLKDLRENNPTLYEEAFKPENWNWQLAYLDTAYFEALVDDPSRRGRAKDPSMVKFKREALYPINPTLPPGTRDPLNPFSTGQTRLKDDEQMIQGAFLFNLFTPSIGWNSINPDMEIELEIKDRTQFKFVPAPGSTFGLNTTTGNWINGVPFIGFDGTDPNKWVFSTNSVDSAWGGRRYGGTMPFEYLFAVNGLAPQGSKRNDTFSQGVFRKFVPEIEDDRSDTEKLVKNNMSVTGGRTRLSWLDRGYEMIPDILRDTNVAGDLDKIANSYRYDLVTVPFKIANARIDPTTKMFYPGKVDFKGGQVTFRFYQGGEQSEGSAPKKGADQYGVAGGEVIQTVTIEVPDFEHVAGDLGERRPIAWDSNSDIKMWQGEYGAYFNEFDQLEKDSFGFLERNNLGADPSNPITNRGKSDRTTRLSSLYGLPNMKFPVASGRFGQISVNYRPSPFGIGDIVQSVEIADGDARVVAGRAVVTKDELFAPHRYYGKQAMAHSQTNAGGGGYMGASIEKEYLIIPDLPGNAPYNQKAPLPFSVKKSEKVQLYGDFDNGAGLMIDGPYINKPDEGNVHSLKTKFVKELESVWESRRNYGEFPYFNREDLHEAGGPAYFSPNRIVSGAGMFGSLPTGVLEGIPWRTLLFRPATSEGGLPGFLPHPGGASPPDHLIMDLFWMPVVEPYAISEPLSTAGKINLNFQIVPFLHIDRSTALRGVFRSEMMLCIPNKWHQDYKHLFGRGRGYHWRDSPYGGALQGKRLRSVIREDDTLAQFTERFDHGNGIFKSSTEICEIHLIPEEVSTRLGLGTKGAVGSYTPKVKQMENGEYWHDHSLVGDNSRERPYANIQARVTTKSNTFLVHYRAQVLKQARRENSTEYGDWRPELDTVQAEYRGSSMVERYVNPDADDIWDFALGSLEGLDKFYRYRVVNPRRFSP